MHIFLGVLAALLLLRVLCRLGLDFPPYPGYSPLQGSDVEGLMPEDPFWALIHESKRRSGGNHEVQIEVLTELLEGELPKNIVAFQRAYAALVARVNDFRYWEAAYALNWGCSDDNFHYFCTWWIGQGKNKLYWSIRFPRLLFFFAVRESSVQYEGLEYAAAEAYEQLTGKELPMDDFPMSETRGKMFSEELALLRYPELALLAW